MIRDVEVNSNRRKNEFLKVIAIVAMFIDHIGITFFRQYEIFRIIGRIAMPIFAYQLAQGFIHTSDIKKYLKRIWIFALIAQIPYTLLFDTTELNILFPFFLSLFLMDRIEKKEYYWIPSIIIVAFMIPMDYGALAVISPCLYFLLNDNKISSFIAQAIIMVMYSYYYVHWDIQCFAIIGILIALFFPKDIFKIKANKYLFYWFYPAHLLVLFIAKWTVIFIFA